MSHKEPNRAAILTGNLVKYMGVTRSVYRVACSVQKMQGLANTLQAIAVRACNGYQTRDHKHDEVAEARDEKKQESTRAKLNALLETEFPGVTATFSGDPRGCVVKITIPGERGDSWGGEGFGVYK